MERLFEKTNWKSKYLTFLGESKSGTELASISVIKPFNFIQNRNDANTKGPSVITTKKNVLPHILTDSPQVQRCIRPLKLTQAAAHDESNESLLMLSRRDDERGMNIEQLIYDGTPERSQPSVRDINRKRLAGTTIQASSKRRRFPDKIEEPDEFNSSQDSGEFFEISLQVSARRKSSTPRKSTFNQLSSRVKRKPNHSQIFKAPMVVDTEMLAVNRRQNLSRHLKEKRNDQMNNTGASFVISGQGETESCSSRALLSPIHENLETSYHNDDLFRRQNPPRGSKDIAINQIKQRGSAGHSREAFMSAVDENTEIMFQNDSINRRYNARWRSKENTCNQLNNSTASFLNYDRGGSRGRSLQATFLKTSCPLRKRGENPRAFQDSDGFLIPELPKPRSISEKTLSVLRNLGNAGRNMMENCNEIEIDYAFELLENEINARARASRFVHEDMEYSRHDFNFSEASSWQPNFRALNLSRFRGPRTMDPSNFWLP